MLHTDTDTKTHKDTQIHADTDTWTHRRRWHGHTEEEVVREILGPIFAPGIEILKSQLATQFTTNLD